MDPWIYIVILGAALIGYAIMRPQAQTADRNEVVNDIETTLSQFAEELEEDNRELIERVTGLKRDLEAEIHRLSGRIEALERMTPLLLEQSESIPSAGEPVHSPQAEMMIEPPAVEVEDPAVEEPIESVESEPNIKNRYNHVFELHAAGKSIEYIAKKTGMNKGEVQLIIQLAKQEEQFRV